MAKTFNDVRGVVAVDKQGNECVRFPYGMKDDEFTIKSYGDSIFKINIESLTIERYVVKYISRYYQHSDMVLYVSNPLENRTMIPRDCHYGRNGLDTYNLGLLQKVNVLKTRNSSGLWFCNIEAATKRLNDFKEKKYFGALRNGDVFYVANKKTCSVKPLIAETILFEDGRFSIKILNGGIIKCANSKFEKSASEFTDREFYTYMVFSGDSKNYSIHMCKEDAEKSLSKYKKAKELLEKKKKEKEKENFVGKLIKLKDSKGNELRIGDNVAYVKKGYYGHTRISTAIVVGESPCKVKVCDLEEKKNGKYVGWRQNTLEASDGIHIIENVNVLFIGKGEAITYYLTTK